MPPDDAYRTTRDLSFEHTSSSLCHSTGAFWPGRHKVQGVEPHCVCVRIHTSERMALKPPFLPRLTAASFLPFTSPPSIFSLIPFPHSHLSPHLFSPVVLGQAPRRPGWNSVQPRNTINSWSFRLHLQNPRVTIRYSHSLVVISLQLSFLGIFLCFSEHHKSSSKRSTQCISLQ